MGVKHRQFAVSPGKSARQNQIQKSAKVFLLPVCLASPLLSGVAEEISSKLEDKMHHFLNRKTGYSLLMSLSLMIASSFMPSFAAAGAASSAPIEKISDQLSRTAASGTELRTHLIQNINRQVPYQDNYTVQVPYQDTETYTENESYTDSEYVCHTETDYQRECHFENQCYQVPGQQQCETHNECHTEGGGQQCHSEQVCSHAGGGNSCHNEQECGTSATGQHICKTRQVCTTDPGRNDCHYENKCYEVPGREVCTPRQECHQSPGTQQCSQQQVCNNVPRSHDVCGYEPVVKTRPVTKTRTVTKYRSEDRCCVTKYRDEYDHSSELDVVVTFPAQAALAAGEQESFELTMTGDEAEPSAKFETVKSVFGYSILSQQRTGRTYQIQLGLVARYSADQLGAATVSGFVLSFQSGTARVSFSDQGQRPRVTSQYTVQILQAGAVVAQAQGVSPGGVAANQEVSLPVTGALDESQSYDLQLTVQRSGIVLAAPVDFTVQGAYDATPLEDAAKYTDISQLTNWDILDVGSQSGLYFKDHTPYNSLVKTTYNVTIQARVGGQLQMVGTASLDRSQVKVNSEGLSQILLVLDMSIPTSVVAQYVTSSAELQVDVEIVRQSSRLNHGQAVSLKKSFIDRSRD
jgi:hypothetical protein